MSLILAVCALCSESISKSYFSRSIQNLAEQLTVGEKISEADKTESNVKRQEFIHKGEIFRFFGMGLAALSLLLWIASGYQRNALVWRYIPFIILVLYLFLWFMCI